MAAVVANDKDVASITVQGNGLSAHVDGAQLETVLYQLSHKVSINIVFPYQVGQSRLWASFKNLPLSAAVRKLLKGHNYILVDNFNARRASVKEEEFASYLKVFASHETAVGHQRNGELTKTSELPQVSDSDQILVYKNNTGLHDPDPLVRIAAIKGLANSHGDAALPFVLPLLHDPDERVKLVSLEILEGRGWSGDIPIDMLERLSLQGNQADVRIRTLHLLSNRHADTGIARGTLELAAVDHDPSVRKIALELLADRRELDLIRDTRTQQ